MRLYCPSLKNVIPDAHSNKFPTMSLYPSGHQQTLSYLVVKWDMAVVLRPEAFGVFRLSRGKLKARSAQIR